MREVSPPSDRIDRAEPVDQALGDRRLGDLARRVPGRGVPAGRELEIARADLALPLDQRVALAEALRVVERPVGVGDLRRDQRAVGVVAAQLGARHADHAPVVLLEALRAGERGAAGDPQRRAVDLVEGLELHRAGGVEVAEPRRVRALVDIDGRHRLRDQEVGVGVALAVAVARHVDRDAVGVDRDVGAVIGVEPADEVLIGLSAAGVLRHHQAGDLAQDVGHLGARAVLQVVARQVDRRRGLGRRAVVDLDDLGVGLGRLGRRGRCGRLGRCGRRVGRRGRGGRIAGRADRRSGCGM